MKQTNFARKIDSQGRLVIPSKLRTALGIKDNQVYDFLIHNEDEHVYLCIDVGEDTPKTKTERVFD